MTQFSSIHPQDLGHIERTNPGTRPALCSCGRVSISQLGHWVEITTNGYNPILALMRESVVNREDWDEDEQADGPWEFRFQRWLQYVQNGDVEPEEGYPLDVHFDHAEKVLRRLIALQGQVPWSDEREAVNVYLHALIGGDLSKLPAVIAALDKAESGL